MSAAVTIHEPTPDLREQAKAIVARLPSVAAYYDRRVARAAEAMQKLRDFYEHREWTKPRHVEIDVTPVWTKPKHFELWNFETKPGGCVVWNFGAAKKGVNTRRSFPRSDSKTTNLTPIRSRVMPYSIKDGTLDDEIEYGTMALLGDSDPITIVTASEYLGGLDDVHKPVSEKYLPEEWAPGEYRGILAEWTRSQDRAPKGLHEEEKDEITKAAQLVRSKRITPIEEDIYDSRAFNTGFKEIEAPESDPDREEKKRRIKDEVRARILAGEILSEGEVITTLGFLEDEPVADTALVAGITMNAEKKRRQRLGGNSKAFKKAWSNLPVERQVTGWYVYVKLPGKSPTMFPLEVEQKPTIEEVDGVRTDAETWAAINAARWVEARKECRLAVAAFLRKRRKLRIGVDANGAVTAEGVELCQSVWSEVYEAFKRGKVCWWAAL